jgi:hypothetical protein
VLRGSDAVRLIVAGVAIFIVCLVPVLVLPSHYYDHYIGTAALGAVVAVVGCGQLLSRHWRWIVGGFSLALLVLDLHTGERAWRENKVFHLVTAGSVRAASWIDTVRHATIDGGKPTRVFLPMNNGTRSIFGAGEAHTFLPGMPAHVTLYKKGEEIDPGPNDVVVKTLPPLKSGEPMPYWSERWDWLRRLARIR